MKRKSLKCRPILIFLILFTLLVCYLLFSDKIYSYLMADNSFWEISNDKLIEYSSDQKVTAYLDSINTLKDDEGEDLKLYGYGYISTILDTTQRRVAILLKSEEKVYEGSINLWVRQDLLNNMQENDILHSSVNLGFGGIGTKKGAGEAINLLTVTPGLYRIGIYVYENDEIYGICWMPVCIKKTFWGGSEIYYGEQVPNFEDVQESDSAKGTVLATWGMEDYFYIPGYAYDTQFGPNNQNVYIEADSADGSRMTYLALPSDSTGNSFYPDETYTDNSFVARIPMDLMPEGKIKLRVILENRETKERIYAFQDIYQIEEGQAHVYRGEVVDNLKEFTIDHLRN